MSAQPPVPSPPTLEGEANGPQYEGMREERQMATGQSPQVGQANEPQLMVNGVDPPRVSAAREEPPPAGPRVAGSPLEGRTLTDEAAGSAVAPGFFRGQVGMDTAISPSSSAGYESLPTRPSSPMRPQSGQPHEAERTVAMEYSVQNAGGQPAATATTTFADKDAIANGTKISFSTSTSSGAGAEFTVAFQESFITTGPLAVLSKGLGVFVMRSNSYKGNEIVLQGRDRTTEDREVYVIGLQRVTNYVIGLLKVMRGACGLLKAVTKDEIALPKAFTKDDVIGLQRVTKDVIGLQRVTKDVIGLQRVTKDVIGLQRGRYVSSHDVGRDAVPGHSQTTEYFDLAAGDRALRDQQRLPSELDPPKEQEQDGAKASGNPSTMELLGFIATGMKQLQEVQLKQMEKKSDMPEIVKPGISSLPALSSPGQDTSPVDIQDWLEEVGGVMTDLSDSSWEWWLQTRDLAEEHYRKWVKSTPMEKISLSMPKSPSLEQGRYGRVNARAAGMVLAALPQEVKSEMITKKVTGSTASLIFRLLTAYRPGGEKEKTLLLQQLTAPEPASTAEEAVQGLRRWGRWHSRAKDLTVTVPDPVLMIKGLAVIVSGVLSRHQDVWLRTSMVRQKLQLDSNPSEESTLDYHKHLQAEMELLSTAAAPSAKATPKIRSATTTAEQSTTAPTATSSTTTPAARPKASPTKDKACKWFAKTEGGCRRGADCQFAHEWGTTAKAGRCLVCSSTGHLKKDCPVKDKGSGLRQPRPKSEPSPQTSATTTAAARALATTPEITSSSTTMPPQPAAEPSPTTSPTSSQSRVPPEEERPGELKQMLADASKMLKTMMANNPSGTPAGSATTPSFESIQRQLDELRLKSMTVDSASRGASSSTGSSSRPPTYEEIQRQLDSLRLKVMKVTSADGEDKQGTLLDSGSTHVLRPAKDEEECRDCQQVFVTLAGDEQRLLNQTTSGSIIVEPSKSKDVQSIIPFGKVIECLGCTLKWSKGGFYLHHPKFGRIKTHVRAGCPEITDAGQAAAIIAELEMKKVAELKEKTRELQDQLTAIRMLEDRKADWRVLLGRYSEQGCAADGLQALFTSPAFVRMPNELRTLVAPEMNCSPDAGWDYLKLLPVPRRMRKRLLRSSCWVLNMFAGGKKGDPIQTFAGATSSRHRGEVVVINVDVTLSPGWNLQGELYKALLWGAMNSKVKAVISSPPVGGLSMDGVTESNGSPSHRYMKGFEMLSKTLFLYLVAYTASEGAEPSLSVGAPVDSRGFWELEMVKGFQEVVKEIGVKECVLEQGAFGHPEKAPVRLLHNVGLEVHHGLKDSRPDHLRPPRDPDFPDRRWCPGLRRAILEGIKALGLGDGAEGYESEGECELRKLTKEQGWRLHIQRDHVPFRKDCEQCVMTLGTGRPHRRVHQKSCYVLSVDVGGPLRFPSKDAHGSGYKYFLAASYTKPRFSDLEPLDEDPPPDLADEDYDFSTLEDGEVDPGGIADDEFSAQGGVWDEDELAEYETSEADVNEDPAMKKVHGTNGLWDDDDLAAIEQEKDAKATEDEEGNAEAQTDFLYYFKPLKGKSGKHVLKAIQEVVLQLRMENLPVVRIHADRAHELRSESLRQWTLDNNILLTRTEGQSPQSNGTAERAVRFLKGRARSLLRSAGLHPQHWATAMATAAHRQREDCLRPEATSVPPAYGTKVAIKKKYYGQGGKLDLLPRWVKGTYMGPVWDVNQGSAILEDETNRFTVSTHVRAKLVDPGTIDQEPELKVEPPPRRRLSAKTTVDKDGLKIKAMSVKEAREVQGKLQREIVDSYVTLGAFQHGGVVGVTNATKDHQSLAKKVCELVTLAFPEEVFSSVTIVRDTCMPVHRDCFNDRKTYNLVIPLDVTGDAAVWEELCPGDQFLGSYETRWHKGREVPGQVHSLKGNVKVRPHRLHCAVQPSEGPRLLLAAHTVGGWKKLKEEELQELIEMGFQILGVEEYIMKRAEVQEHREALHLPWVIEDEDVVHNFSGKDSPAEVDEDVVRCAKAAADNLYTYGIEEILESLQDELRVVHTVHPREVDQHLPSWIPALKAEMSTLEDIGAIKRLVGQAAKDYLNLPGVQVVPGKAVYTVKPPNKPGSNYRRKARIVGCGNFQAKDDSEQNYSGGAAAEAVRLGVAQAARRIWAICTGDVVSAFLRAPVPQGTRLALRPPAVLVRAGLADPSELWSVHMALYGFRSSPRWWGCHRTGIMKQAVTPGGLTFHQGVADSEVWQVRNGEGAVLGLVIIYVDDFFIAAPKEICEDIYKWLADTWETTPIQYASSTSPIRFLGMEVREARTESGEFEGYTLDQEGYLQEVLRHRNVKPEEKSLLPATKETLTLSADQDPPTFRPEDLKLAQSLTGELAWMAQRCRPDLAYVVSIMASLTTRDPVRVAAIGRKALAYLNHTSSWRLRFWTGGSPTLVTYTDSSYAPDGDRSHGGAVTFWGTCPIAWRSSRQQLVTTSSAETELVAAHHGCQQMESIDALLTDMGETPEQRVIYVDNAAAITLATSEGGSWKTRHLKVRHRALRQKVEQGWVEVVYCPGDQQLADGLTKLLASQRMNQMMLFWGLSAAGDHVRLRQVQASAEQQNPEQQRTEQRTLEQRQPAEHTPTPTAPHPNPEGLGCCLGLIVILLNLAKASGEVTNPEAPTALAVDSSLELYGVVLMLGICFIALWECGRVCWRNRGEAMRLRSLQESQKLSKKEMRELNGLLRRNPAQLQGHEKERMIQLAEATGVDLSGILAGTEGPQFATPSTVLGGGEVPPPPPSPFSACAADEEFLRNRRGERRSQPSPPPPPPTYEDIVEEDERARRTTSTFYPAPEQVSAETRTYKSRSVGTQVQMLKEMPKVVFVTPSGTCVHATRDCSTLNRSTKFIQKEVCAKCIPGQKEVTERPM
ncbi:RE1 [Symbiodinium sp. CCMP2592]|nr:RE1 [Symbiodinium sp. CCMP2592]